MKAHLKNRRTKIRKTKTRGQILMELIWLVLFAFAFLSMLAHFYEKGNYEIKLGRLSEKR